MKLANIVSRVLCKMKMRCSWAASRFIICSSDIDFVVIQKWTYQDWCS